MKLLQRHLESTLRRWREVERIDEIPEQQPHLDAGGDFRTQIEEAVATALRIQIRLQGLLSYGPHEAEELHEVALAGPVGTDQDLEVVEPHALQLLNRLEAPDGESFQRVAHGCSATLVQRLPGSTAWQ